MADGIAELAERLGLDTYQLARWTKRDLTAYHEVAISKKGGGTRLLHVPQRPLKVVQRAILDKVLRCGAIAPHPSSTAFEPGNSVVANARRHASGVAGFVLCLDLRDFFPSIGAGRVFGLFRNELRIAKGEARLLMLLTTMSDRGRNGRRVLPQGAPTSPTIANLVCRRLDARLTGLCARLGWTYTRYADDLTISGPTSVSEAMLGTIRGIVEEEGFALNEAKSRLRRAHERQVVTGLCVNSGCPSIPRPERKRLRAVFHQAAQRPWAYAPEAHALSGLVAWMAGVERAANAGETPAKLAPLAAVAREVQAWRNDPERAFRGSADPQALARELVAAAPDSAASAVQLAAQWMAAVPAVAGASVLRLAAIGGPPSYSFGRVRWWPAHEMTRTLGALDHMGLPKDVFSGVRLASRMLASADKEPWHFVGASAELAFLVVTLGEAGLWLDEWWFGGVAERVRAWEDDPIRELDALDWPRSRNVVQAWLHYAAGRPGRSGVRRASRR